MTQSQFKKLQKIKKTRSWLIIAKESSPAKAEAYRDIAMLYLRYVKAVTELRSERNGRRICQKAFTQGEDVDAYYDAYMRTVHEIEREEHI